MNPAFQKIEEWEKFLKNNLEFPFLAEISEFQEVGNLKFGDKLKVHSISGCEDIYGVIVKTKHGRKTYRFPLYDLRVIETNSKNNKLLELYKETFGNY